MVFPVAVFRPKITKVLEKISRIKYPFRFVCLFLFLFSFVSFNPARASEQGPGYADLAVVKPVMDCAALGQADLASSVGASVTMHGALIATGKGQFCQIKGTIAPSIGFEVDLPVAKWSQRYLQAGCGGLCGNINASIGNATTCLPATDGQFVVAASDLGHQGSMMSPTAGDFGKDPQKLIDFAYRANHLTALAAKALIRAYYGQAPRYSYFSGCSDGGREALMEAQRYADDFDGISAGAPAMLSTVQNSFWHAWTTAANLDAAGNPILLRDKLSVLHAAVIAHCDTLDGNKDDLLSDPRACTVDPSWVLCTPGATDTDKCLTPREWTVAAKLYDGPRDDAGHRFLPGGAQPGSELQWDFIPPRPRADGQSDRGGFGMGMLRSMTPLIYRDPKPDEGDAARFPFTPDQFARVSQLHGLLDATNPDLSAFSGHGGKLLMWHGWSDVSIAPMISIAYYQALERQFGEEGVQRFARLFMLPGVGHCGGGDGFAQIDTLTPLMAWVETGVAPTVIQADKIADHRMGPPPGPDGKAPPGMANGPDGRGGGFGPRRDPAPYAQPPQPSLATRPIYAFPFIASYGGSGDPGVAATYTRKPTPAPTSLIEWVGADLIQPGFQKTFTDKDGVLTERAK